MNIMPGGWKIDFKVNSTLPSMSSEQMALFETAFRVFDGADYTPLLYIGSQIQSGVLHAYIAECRRVLAQPAEPTLMKVVLHVDSDNQISISHMSAI